MNIIKDNTNRNIVRLLSDGREKFTCKCGCNQEIQITQYRKYNGVRDYLPGHTPSSEIKKQYYINNPDKLKEKSHRAYIKLYYKDPKKRNELSRKYYEKNKEHHKKICRKYAQDHKEMVNRAVKKWRANNPVKHREIQRRHKDKRIRELGSELLNEWFEGCNRHHINKEQIICIPAGLHKKYPHNHKKPETMIDINRIAMQYLFNCKA